MAARKSKAPWDEPAPASSKKKSLSAKQKQSAKARAKRAGRPYPNLVDNMAVAKKPAAGKRSSKKK